MIVVTLRIHSIQTSYQYIQRNTNHQPVEELQNGMGRRQKLKQYIYRKENVSFFFNSAMLTFESESFEICSVSDNTKIDDDSLIWYLEPIGFHLNNVDLTGLE